jgi:hypothetical protein
MHKKLLAMATIAAMLTIGTWPTNAQPQAPRRAATVWEYREVQLNSSTSATPTLNKFGAEGWELVNVVSACSGSGACGYWAYFKRSM